MFNYNSTDGYGLLEDDNKFYLNITGEFGSAEVYTPANYEDEYPNDFQLLFHSDYHFKYTDLTFSFEADNDKVLLLINKDNEKYYLEYIEDPSFIILRKEKPETPIYITPISSQEDKYINSLFVMKQGDDVFEKGIFGSHLWLYKRTVEEHQAAIILFMKHGESDN